jgi:hypothetical protein
MPQSVKHAKKKASAKIAKSSSQKSSKSSSSSSSPQVLSTASTSKALKQKQEKERGNRHDRVNNNRLPYSLPTVDYRFGVAGREFQFEGIVFSSTQLVQLCVNEDFRATILPNTTHSTPKLIVVPDHNENATAEALAHIDRSSVILIPFRAFLSVLMSNNQLNLLRGLGMPAMQAEKAVGKLTKFCVASPVVHLHGLNLPHNFIREGLKQMGYKTNNCNSASPHNHKEDAVLVGSLDFSDSSTHQVQLSVPDFFSLQPQSDLSRLNKLLKDAVQTLKTKSDKSTTKETKSKSHNNNNATIRGKNEPEVKANPFLDENFSETIDVVAVEKPSKQNKTKSKTTKAIHREQPDVQIVETEIIGEDDDQVQWVL